MATRVPPIRWWVVHIAVDSESRAGNDAVSEWSHNVIPDVILVTTRRQLADVSDLL